MGLPQSWEFCEHQATEKKHRRATCTWLRCVDKFPVNTTGAGLVQFQQPADPTQRESPFTWKGLSGCADMESTGHSGSMASQRHSTLNYDYFRNGSHGGQMAEIDALKKSGMYPFLLAMLVTRNIPHGPWAEDIRSVQIKQSMTEHFEFTLPAQ